MAWITLQNVFEEDEEVNLDLVARVYTTKSAGGLNDIVAVVFSNGDSMEYRDTMDEFRSKRRLASSLVVQRAGPT